LIDLLFWSDFQQEKVKQQKNGQVLLAFCPSAVEEVCVRDILLPWFLLIGINGARREERRQLRNGMLCINWLKDALQQWLIRYRHLIHSTNSDQFALED
jgi:hypothetical protein